MKKEMNNKPVSEAVFNKAMSHLVTKFVTKSEFGEAVSHLVTKTEFNEALLRMATKKDIKMILDRMELDRNLVLDRIDSSVGKSKIIDQEQAFQGLHIKELRETSQQHEKRIAALEANKPS